MDGGAGRAISYVVEAGMAAGASNAYAGNVGAATQLTTPAPFGTYYVRVRGVNALGAGAPSVERIVTVEGPRPPGAPTLAASSSGSTVSLSWTAVASATSYVVDAGSSPGTANVYSGNVGNATQLSAAVDSGTYYIRIRAGNGAGLGPASNEVGVTIASTCTPPEVTDRLSVRVEGAQVTLSWAPPAGATGYVLDVGTRAGFSDLGQFEVTAPSLTTPAPVGGYYVRVRSRNACGLSLESEDMAVPVGDVNMLPQANPDAVDTAQGTPIHIPVTDNDIDPDADDLTVHITVPPAHGTAVAQSSGHVLYSPSAGFAGVDSFSYRIDDGAGGLDATSVSVNVLASGSTPSDAVTFDVPAGWTRSTRSIGDRDTLVVFGWQETFHLAQTLNLPGGSAESALCNLPRFPNDNTTLGRWARKTAGKINRVCSAYGALDWINRSQVELALRSAANEGRCIALVYDAQKYPFRSVSVRLPYVEGLGVIFGGIQWNDFWWVRSNRDGEDWVAAECRYDGAGNIPWLRREQ